MDALRFDGKVIAITGAAQGSMSDLLVRRGLPDYSVMELRDWTVTGRKPREEV